MSSDNWAKFVAAIRTIKYPIEVYFGTNEVYNFNSAENVMTGLKTIAITDEEAETLARLFPHYSKTPKFGWTPIDALQDYIAGV